jgi:phosphoenolpyruvate carboxylase
MALSLARANNDTEALGKMVDISARMTPEESLGIIRAFTQTLNLINSAEVHHRMRLLRKADIANGTVSPLPMREDSIAGTLYALLGRCNGEIAREEQMKKEIYDALLKQNVDIVLTAHPTEVNRRTLLRKYRKISETLAKLDRTDLSPYERAQTTEGLRREVFSIWGSDEIRRGKPTPQQEARGGNAIIETVLWEAIPTYLRKLNAQCKECLGRTLPLDHVPIKFSSWMGGDRDGNPNVTPKVTFEVVITQRMQV